MTTIASLLLLAALVGWFVMAVADRIYAHECDLKKCHDAGTVGIVTPSGPLTVCARHAHTIATAQAAWSEAAT